MISNAPKTLTTRSRFLQNGSDGKLSGLFPQLNIHSTAQDIHDAAVLTFSMVASNRFSNEEIDAELADIMTMLTEIHASGYVLGLRNRAAEEGAS